MYIYAKVHRFQYNIHRFDFKNYHFCVSQSVEVGEVSEVDLVLSDLVLSDDRPRPVSAAESRMSQIEQPGGLE